MTCSNDGIPLSRRTGERMYLRTRTVSACVSACLWVPCVCSGPFAHMERSPPAQASEFRPHCPNPRGGVHMPHEPPQFHPCLYWPPTSNRGPQVSQDFSAQSSSHDPHHGLCGIKTTAKDQTNSACGEAWPLDPHPQAWGIKNHTSLGRNDGLVSVRVNLHVSPRPLPVKTPRRTSKYSPSVLQFCMRENAHLHDLFTGKEHKVGTSYQDGFHVLPFMSCHNQTAQKSFNVSMFGVQETNKCRGSVIGISFICSTWNDSPETVGRTFCSCFDRSKHRVMSSHCTDYPHTERGLLPHLHGLQCKCAMSLRGLGERHRHCADVGALTTARCPATTMSVAPSRD